jgi:cyclic pyranopterin monophosphate synthase
MDELSHIDAAGRAQMVDVSPKPATARRATAQGRVRISSDLAARISQNTLAKGNLLDGIQAAKRTDELIPLCHTLPLEHVQVDAWLEPPFVRLRATVTVTAKTGAEMEALTAVSVAALTVIDMGKAVDPSMVIEDIHLVEKSGGRHGHYVSPSQEPQP